MTSITPFLWFDNNVPEAVAFYKSVFSQCQGRGRQTTSWRASRLEGQKFKRAQWWPEIQVSTRRSRSSSAFENPAGSRLFSGNKLTAGGGEESRCGWLKDKIRPVLAGHPQGARPVSRRSRSAPRPTGRWRRCLKMQKIVIADLEKGVCRLMRSQGANVLPERGYCQPALERCFAGSGDEVESDPAFHYLGPGCHEVTHERRLRVRHRHRLPQNARSWECEPKMRSTTGAGPLHRTGLAIASLEHVPGHPRPAFHNRAHVEQVDEEVVAERARAFFVKTPCLDLAGVDIEHPQAAEQGGQLGGRSASANWALSTSCSSADTRLLAAAVIAENRQPWARAAQTNVRRFFFSL